MGNKKLTTNWEGGQHSKPGLVVHGQSQNDSREPSVVVHTYTQSIQEAETGRSGSRGQPWLIGERKEKKQRFFGGLC